MPVQGKNSGMSGGGHPRKLITRQSSIVDIRQIPANIDAKKSSRNKSGQKNPAKVVPKRPQKKEPATTKKEKPTYDDAATKKFDKMLRGDLTDLPPFPKSTVKIFLSSTFSDMRAERNTLAREVYPRLQTYCQSRDLDFQVVDMRWGVTEDSINDHSVENLCLLEIENCQKTSFGPHFVVLSGDRYGFRPIPVNLDIRTFDIIRHEAIKLNLDNKILLEEWYRLDENAVPAIYILQPIRSKFTFYGDFSPGCDELRERDTDGWWSTFGKLQILLRKAADEAFKENKFTAEDRHQFFQSVTESEIQDGILKAANVDSHCLVYKRTLRHLSGVGINDKVTPKYIDVIKLEKGNALDKEVEKLKVALFEDKVCRKLSQSNIKQYSIHWMPEGVNPDNTEEHGEYLNTFCQDFISDCKALIQKAEEEKKKKLIPLSNYYTDYNSTIHHLRFCVSKCESFCGQDKVLEVAKSYILDKSGRKPLVLYAASGVGKTAIMAKIMEKIPDWLNNGSHLKLIRFLGTSPLCYNVYDVLFDVIGHLADVYDIIMSPPCYKTLKRIVDFAPRFIRQVANNAKEPIIILLDSLDQLEPRNNAYAMDWLPIVLPQNVKLIVSTLPNEHNILTNLKKRLPDQNCYFEIPGLTEETARKIIATILKAQNRSLTKSQDNFFWTIFKATHGPLFLKLLLDEAKKWKSYTPKAEIELVHTVKKAISKLFKNLENKFGTVLVSHALGFITVGMIGLTEYEIEDALSCDDDVLNEVYKFHDPPVQGIVQIPPLLWARIWYDIRGYLVERISHGKSTLNWFHREFVISASEMYATGDKKSYLNMKLFEVFLQEKGIKRTIVLKNRNNLLITDADRQVTPQPYKADNKRKLACLPYHSLRSFNTAGLDTVKRNVYCNFKYLCSKITTISAASVINDLSDFIEASDDEEVRLLYNFFFNSRQDLTNHGKLAICLLAYVNPEEDHFQLKELRNEAAEFLESLNKPVLIPEFPCLAQRREASNAFQSSIQGVAEILSYSSSTVILRKYSDTDNKIDADDIKMPSHIAVWSSETHDMIDLNIQVDAKPVGEYIITDENLYFITKHAIVRHWFIDSKSEVALFEDILPDWAAKQCVKGFVANSDATTGALIQDRAITLISLEKFKYMQTYKIPGDNFVTDHAFVSNNVQKLIAVGTIHGSDSADSNSFILVFEEETKLPIHSLEFTHMFDARNGVLSSKDHWLLVPSETDSMKSQTEIEKPECCGCQLLAFHIGENHFDKKDINIVSPISKVAVHPERGKIVFLTKNGRMFSVLANEFSSQAVVLEMDLKFSIKDFAVYWENEISLFYSNGGQLTLYDLKSDSILLTFTAHCGKINDIYLLEQQLITLGEDKEMRSWDMKYLIEESQNAKSRTDSKKIKEAFIEQSDIVSLSPSYDGDELLTVHDDGTVKIWNMDSQKLLCQRSIGIAADIIHLFSNNLVSFLDTSVGRMKILDIKTWIEAFRISETIQGNILNSTADKRDNLYIVSAQKTGKEQIDIVNIGQMMIVKTIHLQNSLSYKSLEAVLSVNERYLVLRVLMSERQFEQVRELYHQHFPWKKGGFTDQNHRYRFTAVALSEGSGALKHCYRIAAKVPTIGIHVKPYKGNVMLISTQRWILFWDIPTRRCDRKPSPLRKVPMFSRLAWIGKESIGETRVLVVTPDQKYVTTGSDDGYVFVYDAETGLPVCSRKPLSKHIAGVQKAVVSPDSKFVVSNCNNCAIKLWDTATGTEQFSVRLDAKVKMMSFTPDSQRLVLFTGTYTSRLFVFKLTSGKKK